MSHPSLSLGSGFVGRTAELATLTAMLAAARTGRGGLALLAGEPGIGKTRLAEELAVRAADAGMTTFWGRCYEGEGAPPYWPWVQILRARLRGHDAEAVRTLAGPALPELAALLPDLASLLPERPSSSPLEGAQARFHLFDSLATFFARAADPAFPGSSPSLLILDDLHWADPPALQLLDFLARELANIAVLVVATYRDAEVDPAHPFMTALATLSRARGIRRFALRGLTPEEVGVLLAGEQPALPDSDPLLDTERGGLAAALHEFTSGNPLFLHEAIRHLDESGFTWVRDVAAGAPDLVALGVPPGAREVIRTRLMRLSPDCRRLLAVAAVIGREFDLPTLAAVFELAHLSLLEALDEARQAHLLIENPGPPPRYQFSHPLLRETLYADLGTATRVRLHRQVGEAIEALHGAGPGPYLAELARHFAQAAPLGEVEKAVVYAEQAAVQARQIYADAEAVRSYQTALQLLELRPPVDHLRRAELLLALSEAQSRAGDYTGANATAVQAADLARDPRNVPSPHVTAGLLVRAATVYGDRWLSMGMVDMQRIRLIEEALAELDEDAHAARAGLLGRLVDALKFGDGARRWAASEAAVRSARLSGDPAALLLSLPARIDTLLERPAWAEREALLSEALALAADQGRPDVAFRVHAFAVRHALETGDRHRIETAIAACRRLTKEIRYPLAWWRMTVLEGLLAELDGRLTEAEELARRALALGELLDAPGTVQLSQAQLFNLLEGQGRYAEIEPAITRNAAVEPDVPVWACFQAALWARLGRTAEARQVMDRLAVNNFAAIPREYNWLLALSYLAETSAALEGAPYAAPLTALLAPAAGTIVAGLTGTICRGAVDHYLGLLAAAQARACPTLDLTAPALWEAAGRHFTEAALLHQQLGAPALLAGTQIAHAEALYGWAADGKVMAATACPATVQDQARLLAQSAATAAHQLKLAHLAGSAERVLADLSRSPSVPVVQSAHPVSPVRRESAVLPAGLTVREAEVLRLLAAGRTNKEIAGALVVSPATVYSHTLHIYAKIGARGRADAIAFALRHGLVADVSH